MCTARGRATLADASNRRGAEPLSRRKHHMATVSVQHYKMFIGGEEVDSDQHYELRSPATGEVFATVAKGGIEHADRAVEIARKAFESGSWSRKSPEERGAIMKRVADRLATEIEELIGAEISCNGA